MTLKTNPRLGHLPPYFFARLNRKISDLRAEGHEVLRLDIGSPDMPPLPEMIERLYSSAKRSDAHGYQPHQGSAKLLNAWSDMYSREFGVALDPKREIVPLLGSKEGIFNLTMAIINAGDLVLIPDPSYPVYVRSTLFCGGEIVTLPLMARNNYIPDLEAIPEEIANKARILWLNYPNNPTSAVAGLEFFSKAVHLAKKYGWLICHDAAYSHVTYDGYIASSILQVPGAKDVAVEFASLSKSHNMAGWRIGAAVGNDEALAALFALKTNIDSGHFLPIWEAATDALTGNWAWMKERNEIYRQRRDIIIQTLHEIGLNSEIPKASLYIWSPIPGIYTAEKFTSTLLEEKFVSLTPGTTFGKYGEGYVRISLACPQDIIIQAMERIVEWWEVQRGIN